MGCCGNGLGKWMQAARGLPKLNGVTAQKLAMEAGKHAADPALIERRIAICQKCPYYKDEKCNRCGCVLVGKVGKARESCPVGSW